MGGNCLVAMTGIWSPSLSHHMVRLIAGGVNDLRLPGHDRIGTVIIIIIVIAELILHVHI